MTRRRGKQTRLQEALTALTRSLEKRSPGHLLQIRVAEAWEKVAGPVVASHTAKAHLRGRELVVHVDSPIWATELTALAGPYREAIDRELGCSVVESVRFCVSRELARSQRPVGGFERAQSLTLGTEPSERRPLTVEERAAVERSASRIEDDRLRELAIRVTVAAMERERASSAADSDPDEPGGHGE